MKMNYSYDDYPIGAEKFVPLNYQGQIIPKYLVTDYGRVYNDETHRFSAIETTYNGYQRVRITPEYRKGTNYSLHRCVKLSFDPIENFQYMQVNHLDGDKTNNKLENLEWTTPMENIKHADDNGLRHHKGSTHPIAKHTEEQVHEICRLIDQGYTNKQIAVMLQYDDIPKARSIINTIRTGLTWNHVSVNYEFMKNNIFRDYDENFAHQVCQILSEPNHNYTYFNIMEKLNLSQNEYINFRNYIHKLFNKGTATLVSAQYPNMTKPIDY